MKKIDIKITNAAITSFTVQLNESKPEISATIKLMTKGGKEITTYTVSTCHWQDANKIRVPDDILIPIVQIADKLEEIVTGHCKNQNKQLKAGNKG